MRGEGRDMLATMEWNRATGRLKPALHIAFFFVDVIGRDGTRHFLTRG